MSSKIGDAGYRIIGPIASGGMGEVYKAEHVITRRVEAIKLLSGAGTAEEGERFLREIQLQASLSHPNIAAVYNAFRVHDDLVMVMELVEGEPLKALLAQGRLALPVAVSYACQALRAIAYAHAHGVIHRDITPANIIITPQGVVKLTDFGLAKAAASPSVSQSGSSMGSPHYMSPEQVKDSTRTTARSDIYSLGAVLYEMVTGRKPFEGDSSFYVMQAQVEQAPVPPIQIEPKVPPALNNAILKALAKDPADRFASADAFRVALENMTAAQAIVPAKKGSAKGGKAAAPREKQAWSMATASLLFAGVCAVILPVAMVIDSERKRPGVWEAMPKIEIPAPGTSAPPPLVESPPTPAAESPAPAAKVGPRPVSRRRTKTAAAAQPDLTPRILGQESPIQVRAQEPVRPGAAPETKRPEEQPAAAVSAPKQNQAGAVASAAAEKESAGGSSGETATADSPADDTSGKDKKPHGRVRRALGKILGAFH